MKVFKPTYLYVKTHNVTGLKYFGKTTATDPYKYKGSGHIWKRHIEKHGYDVTTEVVAYFTGRDECIRYALDFSEKHDIIASKEWANLMLENGVCGGDTVLGRSKESARATNEKRKQTMNLKTQKS